MRMIKGELLSLNLHVWFRIIVFTIYIYPEESEDDRIQEIICEKMDMLTIIKGKSSMTYCSENDRIYIFTEDGDIIVDGETTFEDELPEDSNYLLHPMTNFFNTKEYAHG